MRSEASGSNSGVTDESSLHTALYYSLGYSDTLVQNQNQLIPVFPSLQNTFPINVTMYDAPLHPPPPPPVSYYPSECTTPHMNYGYGSIPSDMSFFNKFIASQNSGNWVSSGFSNELSLSLAAASRTPDVNGNSIQEQCSEMSSSSNALSCSNSYKPLHLSHLLSGSSFLQAMQEILAEIACFALENLEHVNDTATGNDRNRVPLPISSENVVMFQTIGRDVEAKKKRLLALLQVVDDQYSQCLDEIHTVISAFHAVTELDPNLHARFALPAISLMYKNLREKISSHILAMGSHHSHGGEVQSKEDHCSLETSFIQKQWALQQLRKKDNQLWRPQRGLPERSVAVLRAWMFQNFLHPYPKDAEKHLLAMKSGLTRSQVSNWFINARVRLWKPMIEEMYAEMNRRKARINANDEEEAHGSNRIPVRSNHARFMDS